MKQTVIDIKAGEEPVQREAEIEPVNLTDQTIENILEDINNGGYTERRIREGTY